MKIGILTFHWASNYGAVLQAYALQEHLRQAGHAVEIINYQPVRVIVRLKLGRVRERDIAGMVKTWRIRSFRRRNLHLSRSRFYSSRALRLAPLEYDAVVCGSDQVWNEWFVLWAEPRPTLSYYLDFVPGGHRVAYAVSFGTEKLTDRVAALVAGELAKFSAIGVREDSGQAIVKEFDIEAEVVLDPTLLLERRVYDRLLSLEDSRQVPRLMTYLLHKNQEFANAISDYVRETHFVECVSPGGWVPVSGVEGWLAQIRGSQFVVTNSYHGVIFSIIYHKPFIVVPVAHSNMNGRIETLLGKLDLLGRIANDLDHEFLDRLVLGVIDWVSVDVELANLRAASTSFLSSALMGSDV